MQEKREHPRFFVNLDVSVELEGRPAVQGVAKDISLGGMFIVSDEPLDFGVKVHVVMRLTGIEGNVRLPAVVRWTKPDGFGVQFGLLGARETHAITRMMKH